MIDLMRYLPPCYQDSKIMSNIQKSIEPEIMDFIGYLWKVYFISTCPDEYLWLWEDEFGVKGRDALLAKLRGSTILNKKLAHSMGFELIATYELCPEDGYFPSDDASFFPDGKYYGPLITEVVTTPEKLELARQMIEASYASGFNYWLSVKLSEFVYAEAQTPDHGASIYTALILPSPDDYLSGAALTPPLGIDVHYQLTGVVPDHKSKAVQTANYQKGCLKITEFGGLEFVRNYAEYKLDKDKVFSKNSNAAELLAYIFGTGPATVPAENRVWRGYSFKASVPTAEITEERTINITTAVDNVRNYWSPTVSFLETGVTFLDTNINAQTSNITVEVG